MDIERLKELKDYLRVANELSILNDDNLMQRIVDNNDVTNTIDIAIELLNAEIARQSVTDEAVQRAIAFYELNLQSREDDAIDDYVSARMRIVLAALRQMRTEPCWYCKGIESHNIKSVKTVTDESDRELGAYDTPYNFCPNCGRKLVK